MSWRELIASRISRSVAARPMPLEGGADEPHPLANVERAHARMECWWIIWSSIRPAAYQQRVGSRPRAACGVLLQLTHRLPNLWHITFACCIPSGSRVPAALLPVAALFASSWRRSMWLRRPVNVSMSFWFM